MITPLAESMGIPITDKQAARFGAYRDLLTDWNRKINLTAITGDDEIDIKHFLDSIALLRYLPENGFTAIDVGAGAGFPGLPLAIMREDMDVTLLDALGKRVNFLQEAASQLELQNCRPLHGRAEDMAKEDIHRERYDICFARAVAELPVLTEICLAFVKPGGLFLAMKGPDPSAEVERGRAAIQLMGGDVEEIGWVELPRLHGRAVGEADDQAVGFADDQAVGFADDQAVGFADDQPGIIHSVIIVRKNRHTPLGYPRKPAKIKKSPII